MKTALVLDWPSADAAKGQPVSQWEAEVTAELQKLSGFYPDATFVAHPAYVHKWNTLWEKGKLGGELTPTAQAARQNLIKNLEGYDIALTMGAHAMYCLTDQIKIDTYRGTHIDSPHVAGLQVVPTYAPWLFAQKSWGDRPVVASAMRKATKRFVDRPRTIYVPENLQDFHDFEAAFIKKDLVFDVETNLKTRITEFSLATSSAVCLYVLLEDRQHRSYWTEQDETAIFIWLAELAKRKDLSWGFHNAIYDLTYLDKYGVRPAGPIFDTMLRHHAFQAEWEKSLGFLTSLHVPTRAWKHLRKEAIKNYNKAGAI